MHYGKEIYADEGLRVNYDDSDPETPIGIDTGGRVWLGRDEAIGLAKAILSSLGETPEPVEDDTAEGDFNEAALKTAAAYGRRAKFTYAKGDGNVLETRRLVPHNVYQSNAGHLVVAGYDHDRDEPRAYRLDRIKGHVVIG
jgi:hypothetical protein